MPNNQLIAYTLTRIKVPDDHLITKKRALCLHTMFYWLGEQSKGRLEHQKSREAPQRSKFLRLWGPLGNIEL